MRVKDSVEYVWWFSKTPHPKADNRKVLRPYSADMIRLARAENPRLIVAVAGGSVPDSLPPGSAWAAELLAFAHAGFASVNGRPGRSPLKGSGMQANFLAGVAGVGEDETGCLRHRERVASGGRKVERGEWREPDGWC